LHTWDDKKKETLLIDKTKAFLKINNENIN